MAGDGRHAGPPLTAEEGMEGKGARGRSGCQTLVSIAGDMLENLISDGGRTPRPGQKNIMAHAAGGPRIHHAGSASREESRKSFDLSGAKKCIHFTLSASPSSFHLTRREGDVSPSSFPLENYSMRMFSMRLFFPPRSTPRFPLAIIYY